MMRMNLKKSVKRIALLGLLFLAALSMMAGCGKRKEDQKKATPTEENAPEEAGNRNKSRTNELTGVWHLNADTPAGDPYIFELEFDRDGHVSYAGYSMTGNNWFQNFCYDGTVSHKSVAGLGEVPVDEYFIEYEDGSFDIRIEASELDANGTETDRITCEYNVKISADQNSMELKHISEQYLGFEETEDAVKFVRADRAINPGDPVVESENNSTLGGSLGSYEPTSEQLQTLEEAISIFPISPLRTGENNSKADLSNAYWEVLGNWRCFADNQKTYAGLDFATGKQIAPDTVYSAYGYFDSGDEVDYVRTDTAMLETALRDFFDTDADIDRNCFSYDCKVDNDYVTLWGPAYLEANEFSYMKWLAFKDHMEGDTLVIDAMYQDGNSLETIDYALRFSFYHNPDSFYGYSLIDYETVRSEYTPNYTFDQVKNTEKFIREFVNGNSEGKDLISLKAGTDGCPYARELYYINGTPIFAYYHSATDGSPDNRYYFQAGRMIEWIEGNGNDDSTRERYYVSDSPLNSRWKETEGTILNEAKHYAAERLGYYYE